MQRLGLRHARWLVIGICVGLVGSRFTDRPAVLLLLGIAAGLAIAVFERRGTR